MENEIERLKVEIEAKDKQIKTLRKFVEGLSKPEQCHEHSKCESYNGDAATNETILHEQRSACLDCISLAAEQLLAELGKEE